MHITKAMHTAKLDKIDCRLLNLLQTDADVTNAYLAAQIGLSQAAVFERVKRLETTGYIKNYYAQLDGAKVGAGATFFLQISLNSNRKSSIDGFLNKIVELDQITECHHITGSAGFLLKVVTKDMRAFECLVMEEMSQVEEIGNLQSMVVLSVMKDSKVVPIPVD